MSREWVEEQWERLDRDFTSSGLAPPDFQRQQLPGHTDWLQHPPHPYFDNFNSYSPAFNNFNPSESFPSQSVDQNLQFDGGDNNGFSNSYAGSPDSLPSPGSVVNHFLSQQNTRAMRRDDFAVNNDEVYQPSQASHLVPQDACQTPLPLFGQPNYSQNTNPPASLPSPPISDVFAAPTPTNPPSSKRGRPPKKTAKDPEDPVASSSVSTNQSQPPPIQFDIFFQYVKVIKKKKKGTGTEYEVEPQGCLVASTDTTWASFLDEAARVLHTRVKFLEIDSFQWCQGTAANANKKGNNRMRLTCAPDWSAMCRSTVNTNARSSKAITLDMKPPLKTFGSEVLDQDNDSDSDDVSKPTTKKGLATTVIDEKYGEVLKTYPIGNCSVHPTIHCFEHEPTGMHFDLGFRPRGLAWSTQILDNTLPDVTMESIPLGSTFFSPDKALRKPPQSKDITTIVVPAAAAESQSDREACQTEPAAAPPSTPSNVQPTIIQGYHPSIHPSYTPPYNPFLVAPPPSMGYLPASYPLSMHPGGFAPQPMMAPSMPFGGILPPAFPYHGTNFAPQAAVTTPPSHLFHHQNGSPPSPTPTAKGSASHKRCYSDIRSSSPPPMETHISLDEFSLKYGLSDDVKTKLLEMQFEVGDVAKEISEAKWTKAGFTDFSWKRVLAACKRYKRDRADGVFDEHD
ncbi:hypothetical protein AAF712_001532 [Marasmius tenuissimus]|uniref:Uncharacterized protein n=1 Tax=Marasmius tenuissimus TaxID=585030 RepID=A0ABR3ADQ9_9AGAR